MKIAVINVTKSGQIIAEKLKDTLDIKLFSKDVVKELGIKEVTKTAMKEYKAVIFISSTGIAVRAIAEYIKGKDEDPAVLVIDSCGKFAISLLSGHLGGANELTLKVSEILNNTPVITTATDNLGVVAPDMIAKDNGLVIDNLKNAKEIAALLVEKKNVGFVDLKDKISIPIGYTDGLKSVEGLVYVTHNLQDHILEKLPNEIKNNQCKLYRDNLMNEYKRIPVLKLVRRDIVLGIGCRKNFNPEEMKHNIKNLLKEKNLDERSVRTIATVEVKMDEQAILKLAEYFRCELKIYSIDEIRKVHNRYEGSDFVEKTIGVRAVSEPCVELTGARLITDKIKINGMTVCLGELY